MAVTLRFRPVNALEDSCAFRAASGEPSSAVPTSIVANAARVLRRDQLPPPPALTHVGGLGTDQPPLADLLQAVRRPACHAADGKDGGEELARDADAMQQE